jgi:hypothetical protein
MTEPRTTMGREWLELLDQDAPTAANDPEEWAAEWHAWRNDMEHRIITIEREASATTPSLPLMDNDHRRLTNIGEHDHDEFGPHAHIVVTWDPLARLDEGSAEEAGDSK